MDFNWFSDRQCNYFVSSSYLCFSTVVLFKCIVVVVSVL